MQKLLDYTTTIAAEKTVSEIQSRLAQAGASHILHGFDKDGRPNELSFRIQTQFGVLTFRLPAHVEAVQAILQRQCQSKRRSPYSSRPLPKTASREHASNVAWRILKDWVEAQIALMRSGMITVEQAFLPYCQGPDGQTVYESLRDRKFSQYALTEGSNESV